MGVTDVLSTINSIIFSLPLLFSQRYLSPLRSCFRILKEKNRFHGKTNGEPTNISSRIVTSILQGRCWHLHKTVQFLIVIFIHSLIGCNMAQSIMNSLYGVPGELLMQVGVLGGHVQGIYNCSKTYISNTWHPAFIATLCPSFYLSFSQISNTFNHGVEANF